MNIYLGDFSRDKIGYIIGKRHFPGGKPHMYQVKLPCVTRRDQSMKIDDRKSIDQSISIDNC